MMTLKCTPLYRRVNARGQGFDLEILELVDETVVRINWYGRFLPLEIKGGISWEVQKTVNPTIIRHWGDKGMKIVKVALNKALEVCEEEGIDFDFNTLEAMEISILAAGEVRDQADRDTANSFRCGDDGLGDV